MKKCFSVALFIFFCSNIFAQVGYLGKRVVINADAHFATTIFSTGLLFKNIKHIEVNYYLNPNIEFVVAKRFSLGVGYLFTQGNGERYNEGADLYDKVPYVAQGVGISAKLYSRSAHAPFGTFYKLEGNYLTPKYDAPKQQPMMGGKFEFGKDFLFFNRLRVSSGIYAGLLLRKGDPLSSDDEVSLKITQNYLFGVHIGIGFLAF